MNFVMMYEYNVCKYDILRYLFIYSYIIIIIGSILHFSRQSTSKVSKTHALFVTLFIVIYALPAACPGLTSSEITGNNAAPFIIPAWINIFTRMMMMIQKK